MDRKGLFVTAAQTGAMVLGAAAVGGVVMHLIDRDTRLTQPNDSELRKEDSAALSKLLYESESNSNYIRQVLEENKRKQSFIDEISHQLHSLKRDINALNHSEDTIKFQLSHYQSLLENVDENLKSFESRDEIHQENLIRRIKKLIQQKANLGRQEAAVTRDTVQHHEESFDPENLTRFLKEWAQHSASVKRQEVPVAKTSSSDAPVDSEKSFDAENYVLNDEEKRPAISNLSKDSSGYNPENSFGSSKTFDPEEFLNKHENMIPEKKIVLKREIEPKIRLDDSVENKKREELRQNPEYAYLFGNDP